MCLSPSLYRKVADEMSYGPDGNEVFSKTGCKRVQSKVDMVIEELVYDHTEL